MHEPHFEAAKALLQEQKNATGNPKKELAVLRQIRRIAANTTYREERTMLALDIAATRLGVGERGVKELAYKVD